MDKKNKHRGNLNIKNSWRTAYENYFDETQVGSEQAHKRKKNALIALVSMLLLMLAGLFVGNAWARHGGYDGDDYNLGTVNIGQTYSSGTFRTDNAVAVEAKIKVNSVWRDGRNICVNFTSSTYSGRYDHDVNQYWAFFSGGSEACYGAYRFREGGGWEDHTITLTWDPGSYAAGSVNLRGLILCEIGWPNDDEHTWEADDWENGVSIFWNMWVPYPAAMQAPDTPTNISASWINDGDISVTWTNKASSVKPVHDVVLQRQTDGGSWVDLTTFGTDYTTDTNISYSDTSVSQGHKYQYRVKASNTIGSSSWSSASNLVYTRPAVASISHVRQGTQNSNDDVTPNYNNDQKNIVTYTIQNYTFRYTIYRSDNDGAWQQVYTTNPGSPIAVGAKTYEDTNIQQDHYYKYYIKCGNPTGETDSGATATSHNTPLKPTITNASYTEGVTTLTWTYDGLIYDQHPVEFYVQKSYNNKDWISVTKGDDGLSVSTDTYTYARSTTIKIIGYPTKGIYYRVKVRGYDRGNVASAPASRPLSYNGGTLLWTNSDAKYVVPSYITNPPTISFDWSDPSNPYVGYSAHYYLQNNCTEKLYYDVTTSDSASTNNKANTYVYDTSNPSTSPVKDYDYQFQDEYRDPGKYVYFTVYADPAHTIKLPNTANTGSSAELKLLDPNTGNTPLAVGIKSIASPNYNSTHLVVNKKFTMTINDTYGEQELLADIAQQHLSSDVIFKMYACDLPGQEGQLVKQITATASGNKTVATYVPAEELFDKYIRFTITDSRNWFKPYESTYYGPIDSTTSLELSGNPVLGSTITAEVTADFQDYYYRWSLSSSKDSIDSQYIISETTRIQQELDNAETATSTTTTPSVTSLPSHDSLSDYSLQELNMIANDIATKQTDSSAYAKFKGFMDAGAVWNVTLTNGKTASFRIIGLLADTASSNNKKTGFTMQATAPIAQYKINNNNTNIGGWKDSVLRDALNPGNDEAIWGLLPSNLRNAISAAPVNKSTHNAAGNKDDAVSTTSEYLFIASASEMFGATDASTAWVGNEGTQYEYWQNAGANQDNLSVINSSTATGSFATRTAYPSSIYGFMSISSSGITEQNASETVDVVPCFSLGNADSDTVIDDVSGGEGYADIMNGTKYITTDLVPQNGENEEYLGKYIWIEIFRDADCKDLVMARSLYSPIGQKRINAPKTNISYLVGGSASVTSMGSTDNYPHADLEYSWWLYDPTQINGSEATIGSRASVNEDYVFTTNDYGMAAYIMVRDKNNLYLPYQEEPSGTSDTVKSETYISDIQTLGDYPAFGEPLSTTVSTTLDQFYLQWYVGSDPNNFDVAEPVGEVFVAGENEPFRVIEPLRYFKATQIVTDTEYEGMYVWAAVYADPNCTILVNKVRSIGVLGKQKIPYTVEGLPARLGQTLSARVIVENVPNSNLYCEWYDENDNLIKEGPFKTSLQGSYYYLDLVAGDELYGKKVYFKIYDKNEIYETVVSEKYGPYGAATSVDFEGQMFLGNTVNAKIYSSKSERYVEWSIDDEVVGNGEFIILNKPDKYFGKYLTVSVYSDDTKQNLLATKTSDEKIYRKQMGVPQNATGRALVGDTWKIEDSIEAIASRYPGSSPAVKWYRFIDGNSELVGQGMTYQYQEDDLGKYIYFTVEDQYSLYDAATSSKMGKIATDSTIVIDGTDTLGDILTINAFAKRELGQMSVKMFVSSSPTFDLDTAQEIAEEEGTFQFTGEGIKTFALDNSIYADKYIYAVAYKEDPTNPMAIGRTMNKISLAQFDMSKVSFKTTNGYAVGSQITASSTQEFSKYSTIKYEWVVADNVYDVDNLAMAGIGTKYEVSENNYGKYLRLKLSDENNLYSVALSDPFGPLAMDTKVKVSGDTYFGSTVTAKVSSNASGFYYAFIATKDNSRPEFTGSTLEKVYRETVYEKIQDNVHENGPDGIFGTDDDIIIKAQYEPRVNEYSRVVPEVTEGIVLNADYFDCGILGENELPTMTHTIQDLSANGYYLWFVTSSAVNFTDNGGISAIAPMGQISKQQMRPALSARDFNIGTTLTVTTPEYRLANNTLYWYMYDFTAGEVESDTPFLTQHPGEEGYGQYTIQPEDEGKYLRVKIEDENGYYIGATSSYYGPINTAVGITFTGEPYLDENISVSFTNNNRDGANSKRVYYAWFVGDNPATIDDSSIRVGNVYSTDRSLATSSIVLDSPISYMKYLWIGIYEDEQCTKLLHQDCLRDSEGNAVMIDKRILEAPVITGTPRVDETLTASMPKEYPHSYIAYNWQVKQPTGGGWQYVAYSTDTFKPTEDMVGYSVRVEAVDNNNLYSNSWEQAANKVLPSAEHVHYDFSGKFYVGSSIVCSMSYLSQYCPNGEKMLIISDQPGIDENTFDISQIAADDIYGREGYSASAVADVQNISILLTEDMYGKYVYGVVYDPERGKYCVSDPSPCISMPPAIESPMVAKTQAIGKWNFLSDATGDDSEFDSRNVYYVWYTKDMDGKVEEIARGNVKSELVGSLYSGETSITLTDEMVGYYIGFTVSCHPIEDIEIGHSGTCVSQTPVAAALEYDRPSMTEFYLDKGDVTITDTRATGYNRYGQKLSLSPNTSGYVITQTVRDIPVSNHIITISTNDGVETKVVLDNLNVNLSDAGLTSPVLSVLGSETNVALYGELDTVNDLSTQQPNTPAVKNMGILNIKGGAINIESADGVVSASQAEAIDHSMDKIYALYTYDGKLVSCDSTGTPDGFYTYKTDSSYDARKAMITDIFVEDGIKEIKEYAFNGCKAVEHITIPEGTNFIGAFAFADCRALKSIDIPDTVVSIGPSAFANCSAIGKVILSENVKSIGASAFNGCESMVVAIVHGNELKTLGAGAFDNSGVLSTHGAIYVDDGMLDTYRTAENWEAYKSVIRVYGKGDTLLTYKNNDGQFVNLKAYDEEGNWTGSLISEAVQISIPDYTVYTLSYNMNKAKNSILTQVFKSSDSATLVAVSSTVPVRDYYTFKYWEYGEHSTVNAGGVVALSKLNPAVRLKAAWTPIDYDLTYDLAGGVAPSNPTLYNVESPDITIQNPTRLGYTFAGWTIVSDDDANEISEAPSTPSRNLEVVIPTGSHGNRALTAHWTPNSYNLVYNATTDQGETLNSIKASTTKSYDSLFTESELSAPEKEGYTFIRWYGTNQSNAITTATKFDVSTVSSFPYPNVVGSQATITALYNANEYTVRFNPNGGTGPTHTQTMIYDHDYTLDNRMVERTGYVFQGWSTTADGDVEYYNEAEVRNLTGEANGIFELYAVWAKADFTIDYTLDGGAFEDGDEISSYSIESETFTLPIPVKEGYTFEGWSGSNGETPQATVTIPKGSHGNLFYQAHWTEQKAFEDYTVTELQDVSADIRTNGTSSDYYNEFQEYAVLGKEINVSIGDGNGGLETVPVRLVDVREGKGLVFMFEDAITNAAHHTTDTNVNGWRDSDIQKSLNDSDGAIYTGYLQYLTINNISVEPATVVNNSAISVNEGEKPDPLTTVTSNDRFYLPSISEIYDNEHANWGHLNDNYAAMDGGPQFIYFSNKGVGRDGNNYEELAISPTWAAWWLRSALTSHDGVEQFEIINVQCGWKQLAGASESFGITPCFCL